MHPDGKVPALAVDDQVLTDEPFDPDVASTPSPRNAKLLPDVGSPMFMRGRPRTWCGHPRSVHPMVRQIRMPVRFTTVTRAACRPRGRVPVQGVCARVDERLDGNDWWYGADWSIVDVYLRWLVTTAASAGFDVQSYPNVVDLVERVQQRPSFQRAQAREDAARASM